MACQSAFRAQTLEASVQETAEGHYATETNIVEEEPPQKPAI